MDVAVVKAGLLALGHHASSCGVKGNGVTFYDVSDPAKPKRLSSVSVPSAHTITAVPGTSYVYVSPGGLGNGAGRTAVVDASDPRKARVVKTFAPDAWGCHDVTFAKTLLNGTLGVCTGFSGVRIWDLTDPLKPRTVSTVKAYDTQTRDAIQFAHGAAISDDGMLLVVNDEAFLGHRCDGEGSLDWGSLHVYDIADPTAPRLLGRIAPPRGKVDDVQWWMWASDWCTSHQLNFVPGTRKLVNAWFTGGVSVWDLTVPGQPREEAHYVGSGAVVWTAHWLAGRIWVNDMARGVEVLRLSVLPTGGPVAAPVAPTWRPAGTLPPLGPRPAPPPRGSFVCKTPMER
jgi:hypothetical protein